MDAVTSSCISKLHISFEPDGQVNSLPDQIADKISQLIIDRDLHRGDKLPNEYELANQFNVGRSTIREAIKILTVRNCVEIKRGKGTFIREPFKIAEDPLGFSNAKDQLTLAKDLIEIRMRLEPWIAALAAQRIQQDEAEKLQDLCNQVKEKILSGEDHFEADIHFHTFLASCTHNQAMPELIQAITYCIAIFTKFRSKDLLESTIKTHQGVVDAVISRDTMAAYKEMSRHVTDNIPALHAIAVRQKRHDIMDELERIKKNSVIML